MLSQRKASFRRSGQACRAFNCDVLSVAHKICPSGRTFDTKVMVAVGFLRWFFNYQREESQLLFETRGVHISTGEISYLSDSSWCYVRFGVSGFK